MGEPIEFCVLISIYENDSPIFLDEALESIYCQSKLPEQVVLVCDGPITLDLNRVLKKYSEIFTKAGIDFINPVLRVNSGLGRALRYGVEYCTKKYIVRMDSDDLSLPERISNLYDFLTNNPDVDVVGSYIEEFSSSPGDLQRFRTVALENDDIVARSKKRNPMNHVTVCINKKSLLDVGNYENVLWHEDYYLWMKMISSGKVLKNIPIVTVNVRVHGFSGRRLGIKYLKSELYFLKKCGEIGMMNQFDKYIYILLRLLFRVMPSKVVELLYFLLRKYG